MPDTLVAGYWVGEWGWELMRWQGHVRHLAKDFDRVVIGCETGHEFLYSDFATEFMVYDGPCFNRNGPLMNHHKHPMPKEEDCKRLVPSVELCKGDIEQDFVKYGHFSLGGYDILMHARATNNLGTKYRNWPMEKWGALKAAYNSAKIGCIGHPNDAAHIEGADDLRGIPIEELADIIASAKVVIGPSSGPMHFASLCNTPHVVWSAVTKEWGASNNRDRYLEEWNPLGTKCTFVEHKQWNPPTEEVIDAVCQYL